MQRIPNFEVNLAFAYVEAPEINNLINCYYCNSAIKSKHIEITFEGKPTLRLHTQPENDCWNTFVTGVNMVTESIKMHTTVHDQMPIN